VKVLTIHKNVKVSGAVYSLQTRTKFCDSSCFMYFLKVIIKVWQLLTTNKYSEATEWILFL